MHDKPNLPVALTGNVDGSISFPNLTYLRVFYIFCAILSCVFLFQPLFHIRYNVYVVCHSSFVFWSSDYNTPCKHKICACKSGCIYSMLIAFFTLTQFKLCHCPAT